MEADAKAAAEEYDGVELQELGNKAWELEQEIAGLEGQAKALKKQLEKLMKYAIPQALAVAAVDEFGFDNAVGDRCRIAMETKVVGSLRQAEDEDDAVAYLEESGLAGVIRKQVALDFAEDEAEQADGLVKMLEEITGRVPHLTRTIHASTLAAFVRAKLKEDPTWDYERVGFTAFPQAKFTKRR
jgi:hypothetical protein